MALPLPVSDAQYLVLEALARARTAPLRQLQRTRALLMTADRVANTRIAAEVGVTPVTAPTWRSRFAEEGLAKLGQVRRRRRPKPPISAEKVEQIVHDTRQL